MQASRRAVQKSAMTSRAAANGQAKRDDKKQLQAWRAAVWKRDQGICQCCLRKVIKTLENVPARGECHHLDGRANTAIRFDVRNGTLVCNDCHLSITGGIGKKLIVVGRKFFTVKGVKYVDATTRPIFREAA